MVESPVVRVCIPSTHNVLVLVCPRLYCMACGGAPTGAPVSYRLGVNDNSPAPLPMLADEQMRQSVLSRQEHAIPPPLAVPHRWMLKDMWLFQPKTGGQAEAQAWQTRLDFHVTEAAEQ